LDHDEPEVLCLNAVGGGDMFDGFKSASWPAKLIAIFVAGILLGLGLCGVGSGLSGKYSTVADGFFSVGVASFCVSVMGLVVALVLLFLFGLDEERRK